MELNISELVIDAIPQGLPTSFNADISKDCVRLKTIFEGFTKEDYKSIFFLLMDYVRLDKFITLTNQEICDLEQNFWKIYYRHFNGSKILVELFGTMKKYKKLKQLGTCRHVYEKFKESEFNQIDAVWKMLYSLCEELTENDVNNLKQTILKNVTDEIRTAEDCICCAFLNKIISKTDFSNLEIIFKQYPKCLEIVKNFEENLKSYRIRVPSAASPCGIALIINFENFDEKSKLPKRFGSEIDVANLKVLWEEFGFIPEVLENLTYEETLGKLKYYAELDHSNHDAFVCCILSHGNCNTIYSSDGIQIPISDFIAVITNNSSSLNMKPKLFFIQACQGTNIHQGVGKQVYNLIMPDSSIRNKYNLQMPAIDSDVVKVISSIEGYVSFRNTAIGSWFINALCESMSLYGDKKSILDVMVDVRERLDKLSHNFGSGGPQNAKQIPNVTYTIKKRLVLKKCIY